MRVPVRLVNYFKTEFEPLLTQFLVDQEMIPDREALHNKRFLNRSVAPHVETLSQLFNRIEKESQTAGIDEETYWSGAGSPKNRRLAYFLSFMPGNIFRVASVWAELHRLGFKWPVSASGAPPTEFRALEWGAGTAAGACGIIAAEKFAPLGIPHSGSFALIEQSKAALGLGTDWFSVFSEGLGLGYQPRPFHRRVDLSEAWLPKNAPKFHLFVMSYFLNEADIAAETLARRCLEACDQHLEDEGLMVIVEPALKLQSRKLLEFRRALIELMSKRKDDDETAPTKILLPCMGHQACGALARPDDWCHEEVQWWRPEYLRELDSIVGLDRKSLPFSYLVLNKTRKPLHEVLPVLRGPAEERYRLVSPSRALGKRDLEFYLCGQEGKRRARYRLGTDDIRLEDIDRGDILQETKLHGEPQLSQIDSTKPILDTSQDEE